MVTTSFRSMSCLSSDLLVLNAALAFFSGVLSVVALSQLVRIHMREKEWTRQKVLHFMIGSSNTGYFVYFVSTHFATCWKWLCWSHVCGFVLMAYPKILLLSAFLLLLSFWVDLCHQSNDEEDDDDGNSTQQALLENSKNKLGSSSTGGHRGCCSFQSLHFRSRQKFVIAVVALLFFLMVSFAVIIGIDAMKHSIDTSQVAQNVFTVYEDIIGIAVLLLGVALGCYGLLLLLKLRKIRSEIASAEMWKVAGLAVTSVVCFISSAMIAIFTDIPLYYHWHLKKIYGIKVVLFLILYYLLGSSVPSAVVLWIMRELPPTIVHRQEQSRIITFIRHATSHSTHRQRQPAPPSSKNQASRATAT